MKPLVEARVALLSGGSSAERSVSLDTAAAVRASLAACGDGRGPAEVVDVDWCAEGGFRIGERQASAVDGLAALAGFDVVFLAVHGGAGEDGTLQGALQSVGVRYTGSGVAASALALRKSHALAVAGDLGLHVPEGLLVERSAWDAERQGWLDRLAPLGGSGWMVKPELGGSSVATARLDRGGDLGSALDGAFQHTPLVRVERVVDGLELTCAVFGVGPGARAWTPVEIVPDHGRFFDFHQKYAVDGAAEHCPPRAAPKAVIERIRSDALRVHRDFGCRGLTRSDFMVDSAGRAVFLELNTLPGLTPRSLAPIAAAHHGLDHRDLCLALLESALATGDG